MHSYIHKNYIFQLHYEPNYATTVSSFLMECLYYAYDSGPTCIERSTYM